MTKLKAIPYAISSYKTIRAENYYYLDKTHYIPQLEKVGKFLFLIRPRRFGKSSLLTVLESYYDTARADQFDFFFRDTYIGQHPTSEKNAYLILKFNFSQISPQLEYVAESFEEHIETCFFRFTTRYAHLLGDELTTLLASRRSPQGKLELLLTYVGLKGFKVYILIDEYDNFTNTILSTVGPQAYHDLTHGAGFLRFFFNILKGTTDEVDTGLARLFITGVSPVTMDDVTSGFNIGTNITLQPQFNELLGFTEADVSDLLTYYQSHGLLSPAGLDDTLTLMREWYDNYRFAFDAETTLFNTDMVLYFVRNLIETGQFPRDMIDGNVRIDYGKLRHLVILDKRLNGNFSYLRQIIETERTPATVANSFPVVALTEPENFVSLLFYFGLLSYADAGQLAIPNQTVRQLMYSYLRAGYRDGNIFQMNVQQLADYIRDMAYQGDWRPVFEFLAAEVKKQTTIRDYLKGEKVIQTFLLAYLNIADYYTTHTEVEMNKGFVDLYLEPFWAKYADLPYTYLIELKYIKRSEFTADLMAACFTEAEKQLKQYANNPLVIKRSRSAQVICVALVFSGWELKGMKQFRNVFSDIP